MVDLHKVSAGSPNPHFKDHPENPEQLISKTSADLDLVESKIKMLTKNKLLKISILYGLKYSM